MRTIPFGYQIIDGEMQINPDEQEAVQYIFKAYLLGATMKQIADVMDVPYREDMAWKMSIIQRILDCKAYLGRKGYPRLISDEVFERAAQRRAAKWEKAPQDIRDIRSITVCRECGVKLFRAAYKPAYSLWNCRNPECSKFPFSLRDEKLFEMLCGILNAVIANPDLLQTDEPEQTYTPDQAVIRQQNEVRRMADNPAVDSERIRTELLRFAAMKYRCCSYNDAPQQTERLRTLLAEQTEQNTLDVGLLMTCVRRITVSHLYTIEAEFMNGVIINEKGERVWRQLQMFE